MRNLRNSTKILEKILKSEPDFLQNIGSANLQPSIETFAPNNSVESGNEDESFEVSDKFSDSFEDDFLNDEESVNSGNDSETHQGKNLLRNEKKSRILNLLNRRKKLDKYFKKGFDIKNLNVGGFTETVAQLSKKPQKKRQQTTSAQKKCNFNHEAFSQKQLLSSALLHENINLVNSQWNKKYDFNELVATVSEKVPETLDFKQYFKYDEQAKQPTVVMKFRNSETLQSYFAFFNETSKPSFKASKYSARSKRIKGETDEEEIKRVRAEMEEILQFIEKKNMSN